MDGPKHSHSPDICNTYHNMKNNLRKSVLTSCLAMTVLCVSATTQVNKQKRSQMVVNPLLRPSTLPYGAPDFSKIKDTDYMPALKAGIEQQRQEINRIVNNKQKPTFANVILAYEKSGQLLNRVSNILFGLTNANKTPALGKAEEEAIALLTAWQNEISFNQPFFNLVKYVYDHEYNKLTGEDKKLLEEVYKGFVRAGALLPADKKARMEQINNRLANLEQQFGNLLPESTNAAAVWVSSKEELAGLSDADIAQCQKDAENLGGKAPYCIVIINTTQQPILASLDNRALREKVYNASVHRADGTNRFNTFALIAEIAKLRAEKARDDARKHADHAGAEDGRDRMIARDEHRCGDGGTEWEAALDGEVRDVEHAEREVDANREECPEQPLRDGGNHKIHRNSPNLIKTNGCVSGLPKRRSRCVQKQSIFIRRCQHL